jgi:hypothetical protein
MIPQSPTFKGFTLKTLLVFTLIIIGFSLFTNCNAQAILGKWKGVSVKDYYNAELAKQIGKTTEEKFSKDVGNSEIDYIADHTFIMTLSASNNSEITIMKGRWNVAGDRLNLTLEPQYNPRNITTTSTFSIHGNAMVTTAIVSPPSRVIKTVSTATRL